MAITKSAQKAIRVSLRKKKFNDRRKGELKNVVKDIRRLVKDGKQAEAEKLIAKAFKALDKGAKKGVIKKNTSSRIKSRLAKAIRKNTK